MEQSDAEPTCPTWSKIGRAEIEKALQVAPSNYQAHLFDGLVLANQDHDYAAAVASSTSTWPTTRRSGNCPRRRPTPRLLQGGGQPLPMDFVDALPATTTTSVP